MIHNHGFDDDDILSAWGYAAGIPPRLSAFEKSLAHGTSEKIAVFGNNLGALVAAWKIIRAYPNADIAIYVPEPRDENSERWNDEQVWAGKLLVPPARHGARSARRQSLIHSAVALSQLKVLEACGDAQRFGIDRRLCFAPMSQLRDVAAHCGSSRELWQPEYGCLPFGDLGSDKSEHRGVMFETYFISNDVMIGNLRADLLKHGAKFATRKAASLTAWDEFEEDVVVNCVAARPENQAAQRCEVWEYDHALSIPLVGGIDDAALSYVHGNMQVSALVRDGVLILSASNSKGPSRASAALDALRAALGDMITAFGCQTFGISGAAAA